MTQRLYDLILDEPRPRSDPAARQVLGVLPGEGIGPEVISVCLNVLSRLESATGCAFEVRTGGAIGKQAESACGRALSEDVVDFCRACSKTVARCWRAPAAAASCTTCGGASTCSAS